MKTIITILAVLFLPIATYSQTWQWASSGGGTNFDVVSPHSIAVDNAGNTYVMGSFYGSMAIDTIQLTGNGWNKDIFWAKFDKHGKVLWAKSIGGKGEENNGTGFGGVLVDKAQNVYIYLSFSDTIVTPEIQVYNSGVWNDLLLIKCDSIGNVLKYKSWGTPFTEIATDLDFDYQGNICIYGIFAGYNGTTPPPDSLRTLRFDSTHTLLSTSKYGGDCFIAILDTALNPLKVKATLGGGLTGNLAVDMEDNMIITGGTGIKIEFDTIALADPNLALYIAKYDSTGHAQWARMIRNYSMGNYWIACTAGSDGSVYCTGTYDASGVIGGVSKIDFGPGTWSLQGDNAFMVKYDANGNILWGKNIGTTARDAAMDIAIDTADNIYITGTYDWWAKFGTDTLYALGGDDIFVNKYDKDGNYIWTATAGGATNDGGYAITLDKNQDIYVGGYISSKPASFGTHQVSGVGAWDMCVAKLSPTPTNVPLTPNAAYEDVHIIPNPNTGNFSILLKSHSYQQLQIINITGKVVHQQLLKNANEEIRIHTKLTEGMYFIKLIGKEKTTTKKFIVNE